MIKVIVSYPNQAGARFDPGAPPEFMIQATLTLESVEAFQAAMATVGPAIMADIKNYTDIQPHIQVNKILGQHPALAAGA
jgi:uncharacterized protein (TIGR02118 family)